MVLSGPVTGKRSQHTWHYSRGCKTPGRGCVQTQHREILHQAWYCARGCKDTRGCLCIGQSDCLGRPERNETLSARHRAVLEDTKATFGASARIGRIAKLGPRTQSIFAVERCAVQQNVKLFKLTMSRSVSVPHPYPKSGSDSADKYYVGA